MFFNNIDIINKFPFIVDYQTNEDVYHAHYRYYAFWNHPTITRDEFIEACIEKEIPIFQGSCSEVYLEKAFEGTASRPENPLKNARDVGNKSLMFLTHPTLTDDELSEICTNLDNILQSING